MYVVNAVQMQALDRAAMETTGIPGLILMENAGRGCTEIILNEFSPILLEKGVTVVAGPGNNGGDGFVIARHLYSHGIDVTIISLASEDKFKGDALANYQIIKRHPVPLLNCLQEKDVDEIQHILTDSGLIVDAIFGTGLRRKISGPIASVINLINKSQAKVAAVDIASGLSSNNGEILGKAIKADITVTMQLPKTGHLLHQGYEHTGILKIVDIGITKNLIESAELKTSLFEQSDFAGSIRKRPLNGHKGTFGHLLIVAGSRGKSGAAGLASLGALRSGAGLVTIASPASVQEQIALRFLEHMTEPLSETEKGTLAEEAFEQIINLVKRKKAVVAGPGMGTDEKTKKIARRLVAELPVPLVADADMLTAIGAEHEPLMKAKALRILTPHPGEMSRLTGLSVNEIEKSRLESASDLAQKTKSVVVLKGRATICASPDGKISINSTGNAGMGTGGMGDVLSGVIGGLLAQGYEPWDAVRMGVYAHGKAGDTLGKIRGKSAGFLASELAEWIKFPDSLTL